MDENRDEVLNELIKYYDSSEREEQTQSAGDMDATRVVRTADSKPAEEVLGNTVVVKPIKKPAPPLDVPEDMGSTVRMPAGAPPEDKTEVVQDEVFGNLGLDGRPISRPRQQINIDAPGRSEKSTDAARAPKVTDDDEDDEMKRDSRKSKRGAWNVLKPLWTAVIICIILSGLLELFTNDHPILKAYQRNFKYNMSLILKTFGIEQENNADRLPVLNMNDTRSEILAGPMSKKIVVAAADPEIKDNGAMKIEGKKYAPIKEKKLSVPFEGAGSSSFAAFNKGVVCAKTNYVCFYNGKGEKKWSAETAVDSPMLDVCGKYFVIAERNGTRVSLFKGSKLRYTVDIKNNIRMCNVSEKGDVVLVTDKKAYKGSVIVLNNKGEEVFVWSSGVNYITSAAMLKSRRVAVSLINGDQAVTSYVMVFDIKNSDPSAGVELADSLVYGVENYGNNILVFGDNSMAMINRKGEVIYDKRYDTVTITHSAHDSKGSRVLTYNRDNLPVMSLYDKKGNSKAETETESVPDCVDVWGDTVLYNDGHRIICGAASEQTKTGYVAPMKVKQLILISDSVYLAVYENKIEMIEI